MAGRQTVPRSEVRGAKAALNLYCDFKQREESSPERSERDLEAGDAEESHPPREGKIRQVESRFYDEEGAQAEQADALGPASGPEEANPPRGAEGSHQ